MSGGSVVGAGPGTTANSSDDGSAGTAYQVRTIPHTVIIDGNGKVATVLRGVSTEEELLGAISDVEADAR